MPQKQGNSTSDGGRLDGSLGTALAAANVAIGAGWGGTATFAIRTGSTDQRGVITITASATTPAQATATIAITFADGAFAVAPPLYGFQLLYCDNAVAEPNSFQVQACSTTVLSCTYGTLPVATKVYAFAYWAIA